QRRHRRLGPLDRLHGLDDLGRDNEPRERTLDLGEHFGPGWVAPSFSFLVPPRTIDAFCEVLILERAAQRQLSVDIGKPDRLTLMDDGQGSGHWAAPPASLSFIAAQQSGQTGS